MPFHFRHDYAADIRNRRFGKIALLIRGGDISSMDITARNLLADYLEGNLRRTKGRPKDTNEFETAEHCHAEFYRLKREGVKRKDALKIIANSLTVENIDTKRIEQHLANFNKYESEQYYESYLCDLSISYGNQILLEYQKKCEEGITHAEAIHFIADEYGVEQCDAERLVKCAIADNSKSCENA
jgi:hypothetical protein